MKNNWKEWGKKEVELAAAKEPDGNQVYNAAYRAFCDVVDHAESVPEKDDVIFVLETLLHSMPLTPIEDTEDEWETDAGIDPATENDNPGYTIYQSKRRRSLFKKVTYSDKGNIVCFDDLNAYDCIDIRTNQMYVGGMGPVVLNEMFPITFPYMPIGKVKIFTEDFKYHTDHEGDYDTAGVLYFRMTDGQMVKVMRFFKKDYNTDEMIEIAEGEYMERKRKFEFNTKEEEK